MNTYTTGYQFSPSIASDAAGNFVVVWESGEDHVHLNYGVFGQRYDSSGHPLGGEFQVNSYWLNNQRSPSVAMSPSGSFVVAWDSDYLNRGDEDIFVRRFDSTGAPMGAEFQVNTYTTLYQLNPSVAMDASGGFVVVWESNYDQDGSEYGVFARRFDSTGAPLSPEIQVNEFTTGDQKRPQVVSDASGSFVVVWESFEQDGSEYGVLGRRFDGAGTPLGSEFQVNVQTDSSQFEPAISMDSSGAFVVVWMGGSQDGESWGIFARRYDSAGAALGGEFQVNTVTTGSQSEPGISANADGNFVVAWRGPSGLGEYHDSVFAQRFDSGGAPAGPEFQVASFTAWEKRFPVVAMTGPEAFVVTWTSQFGDGSAHGVRARRFCVAGDTDADGVCENVDGCPGAYNPGQEDSDGDGAGDICDNCSSAYNTGQQDTDVDLIGDSCDNCVSTYNTDQRNSDGQPEGDACDLTVTFPLQAADVDCSGPPPAITWTTEGYDRFRVYLSWDPLFKGKKKITSGDNFLKQASWTPSAKTWGKVCRKAGSSLYLKVFGKSSATKATEYTETVTIPVP